MGAIQNSVNTALGIGAVASKMIGDKVESDSKEALNTAKEGLQLQEEVVAAEKEELREPDYKLREQMQAEEDNVRLQGKLGAMDVKSGKISKAEYERGMISSAEAATRSREALQDKLTSRQFTRAGLQNRIKELAAKVQKSKHSFSKVKLNGGKDIITRANDLERYNKVMGGNK